MNSIEVILLNFSETRRRSIKLWNGIPNEYLNWRPDENAFTIIEMIRHVLEGEHLFHKIIENKGDLGDYLNRIAYHESVHTGQILSYLRTIGIDRPQIWD